MLVCNYRKYLVVVMNESVGTNTSRENLTSRLEHLELCCQCQALWGRCCFLFDSKKNVELVSGNLIPVIAEK